MTGLVYSYTRFSDPRQATGHSSERQASYASRWAEEHGLRLDESLTMRDEGLSAYHQRHVKSGALGVFLAAVEDGKVPPGSVLVVEGLDRLSRAEPMVAQSQLGLIVNAGITVVTASDNKVYSRERLRENPMDLIYSLLIMIRAHEESHTKSKRVSASILKLCKGWQAGTYRGRIRNGKDPQWVRETETGWELIPERAAAMRLAITMYLKGASGGVIVKKLAEAGASPLSDKFVASHFYKVVKNPALIGTKRISVSGEDFELAGYYPGVLSAEEWSELQAVNGERPKRGSKACQIPHVITGLGITYCGYCGRAMSGQHLFGKVKHPCQRLNDGYRRLLCTGLQYGTGRCPHPKSRSSVPVERAIMNYCSDLLNLRALYEGDRAQPLRASLEKDRARLAEVDGHLEKLTDAMLAAASAAPAVFARKAATLEAERDELLGRIAKAEHQLATMARTDLSGMDEKWRALVDGVYNLDFDARTQARQLVADTFERIVIYASGITPSKTAENIDLVLIAKGGATRMLRVDLNGRWTAVDHVTAGAAA